MGNSMNIIDNQPDGKPFSGALMVAMVLPHMLILYGLPRMEAPLLMKPNIPTLGDHLN